MLFRNIAIANEKRNNTTGILAMAYTAMGGLFYQGLHNTIGEVFSLYDNWVDISPSQAGFIIGQLYRYNMISQPEMELFFENVIYNPNGFITPQKDVHYASIEPYFSLSTYIQNPKIYNMIINQFDVENNPRYEMDSWTYCNKFVQDVSLAMGLPAKAVPIENANNMGKSYAKPDNNWYEVNAQSAQFLANLGVVTVNSYINPNGGSGHVQIVRPAKAGDVFDENNGPYVAQAGIDNFNYDNSKVPYSESSYNASKFYAYLK